MIPLQEWKSLQNCLISSNISVKFGAVPICIRIGISVGSVETFLHIIIEPNFMGIAVGIGQCEHTITCE